MKFSRWVSLAAGCLVMASAGLNYSFSVIAPDVKSVFTLTDLQTATIASTINLGGYTAIFSGWGYGRVQHRHNAGPRFVMWVGCVLMALGYGGIYAQAVGLIPYAYWRVLVCAFVAGNAGTWWDTSVLTTSVHNFPDDRGSVVGILKGFLGLSTSLYATVYWSAFNRPSSPTPPSPSPPLPPYAGTTSTARVGSGFVGSSGGSSSSGWWWGGQDPSDVGGAERFLLFLAVCPAWFNFLGSLFINQVPHEYFIIHEPADSSRPGTLTLDALTGIYVTPPSEQLLIDDVGEARTSHAAKRSRLTFLYLLVAALAVFQAGAALYSHGGHSGVQVEEAQLAVLLLLLSLVLILPATVRGPLATPSLRAPHNDTSRHDTSTRRRRHSPLPPLPASRDSVAQSLEAGTAACSAPTADSALPLPISHHLPCPRGLREPLMLGGSEGQGTPNKNGVGEPLFARHHGCAAPLGASLDEEEGAWGEEEDDASVAESETLPAAELETGQAIRTVEFWVLATQFLAGSAAGLTLLNNLTPLVVALGGRPGGQVAFVSLFSVANAIGRLLFGNMSEHYLHTRGTPRTLFMVVVAAMTTLSCAALGLTSSLKPLYGLTLLLGAAFGGHWSVLPAVASDLFGLTHFAPIYCLLQLAPAVSAYVFASMLAGKVLASASASGSAGPTGECIGLACFGPTFWVICVLSFKSLLLCLFLLHRTRVKYAIMHQHGTRVL